MLNIVIAQLTFLLFSLNNKQTEIYLIDGKYAQGSGKKVCRSFDETSGERSYLFVTTKYEAK